MQRVIVLLLAAAMLLAGCAKIVDSTPDPATADEAAANEATRDEAPTEPPTDPPTTEELALARYEKILASDSDGSGKVDVPEIIQYPELPTGCESVALTIAINHYGYDLSKTDIADDYMVYGDNYITAYCGNPHQYGGSGIYPPGIVKTVWNFVEDKDAELYPVDTTDLTMDELYRFIDAGYPVVVWTTVYMNWPYFESGREYEGKYYPWYDTEHCVCMYGYDKADNEIMISDPQRGKITVSASEFEKIYDEIGRFSVVMIDTSDLSDQ